MYTFLSKRLKTAFTLTIALLMLVIATSATHAQSSTRSLTIKNTGSATIHDVHISRSINTVWESDRLSPGESIAPGQQVTFYLSYGATYDLLVEDAQGQDIAELDNIYMSSNKVWTVDEVALLVENNSEQTICSMYISPQHSTYRGNDWLVDDEVISPDSQQIFYVSPGIYNLQARDCNRQLIASSNSASLYSDKVWTVGQVLIDLVVVNRTGSTICAVYISPTTALSWGSDKLGATEVIRNGRQRTFGVETGVYDLRVKDCSGNTLKTLFDTILDKDMRWTIDK